MKYRTVTALITTALLSSCASGPEKYDMSKSRALNIAKAAGIAERLKDTKVPEDTVKDITDSMSFGAALGTVGYLSPLPNFSSGMMGVLNVASWLLKPESPSARNSLFAWMPLRFGNNEKEAIDNLADILLDATDKAATELDYQAKTTISGKGKNKRGSVVSFTNLQKCTYNNKPIGCTVGYGISDPNIIEITPAFVGAENKKSWFFNPSRHVRSLFKFPFKNNGFNELDILIATSKHLPDWVYFYVAPKTLKLNKTDKVDVPLIINKGEVLYFIMPDKQLAKKSP